MSSLHNAARIHGSNELLGKWTSLVHILIAVHLAALLIWIFLVSPLLLYFCAMPVLQHQPSVQGARTLRPPYLQKCYCISTIQDARPLSPALTFPFQRLER